MVIPIEDAQVGDTALWPDGRGRVIVQKKVHRTRQGLRRFYRFRRVRVGYIGGGGLYVASNTKFVTYLLTDLLHQGVTTAKRKTG